MAFALMVVVMTGGSAGLQDAVTEKSLAEYRLDAPNFNQFQLASRLLANVTKRDPKLSMSTLFTRDVLLLEDVAVAAWDLEWGLISEPRFAAALRTAGMSPRDYTKFALALFAARLAHGFMKSGALRKIPAGAPTDNVKFVETHEKEVAATLQLLGVEG